MAQAGLVEITDVIEGQKRSAFTLSLFVMCCLVMLVDGFNQQSLNYAAPAIIKAWGINRAAMTPVFDINIFGWMLGAIGFSMLADNIGRRNSILLAVFIFGIFTVALPYVATDLTSLAAIRFVSALGVGGAMPMAIAMIADYSQSASRGLKITLLYLGYTLGSSGGGFLAAELTPRYGWQSIFLAGGVTALAIGVVLFVALPESVRYLVLKRQSETRVLVYARKLQPAMDFAPGTRFVINEVSKKGVPVTHLFTDGRAAMTIFLWLALGFSFITHFFLSAWLATMFSEYSNMMSIPAAQRTAALFQAGAAFAWVMGWLLDKKGVTAITWVMLLGALPVAALGLIHAGPYVTMALALISGILVLGGNIGLNALSGIVYPTDRKSVV